jgi:hypothetical protein
VKDVQRISQSATAGQNLKTLLLIFGAIGAVFVLRDWILKGSFTGVTLQLLGILVGVIALASLGNWRTGLYFSLAWLVVEDLPRKYLGNNMLIYFGKDVLVAVTYVSFFFGRMRCRERSFRPSFWASLLLFIWLGGVQVFNPNSPSLFYGLLGLKLYFSYVPLMFLGYALIRSEQDLYRFLNFNLVLGVLVAALGIVQSIVGLDFLNPQSLAPELQMLGRLTRWSPVTGEAVAHPTSVFVSNGRFAWYVLMIFILGLGTAGYQLVRGRGRARQLVFLAVGVVFVAVVMTGSRGTLLTAVGSTFIMIGALLWGAPLTLRARARLVKAVRRSAVILGLSLVVMVAAFPHEVGARWAFYYETLAPSSPGFELVYRLEAYPIVNLMQVFAFPHWPVGYGTGTSSLGVQYVTRLLGAPGPPTRVIENGYGTLILEMGILGPLLWLFWTTALVRSGWREVRRVIGTAVFPVAFAILWFAFVLLFPFTYSGIQAYQNFVFNAFLWLFVGILFRLPGLVLETRVPREMEMALAHSGTIPRRDPLPLSGRARG